MSKLRPSSKQVSHISRQGQGKEFRPFTLKRVQGHWICIIDRSYLVKFRSDSTETLSIKVKKKTSFLTQKRANVTFLSQITIFLSRKFMIMRLSMAFEDLLGSSIGPQVVQHYGSITQGSNF